MKNVFKSIGCLLIAGLLVTSCSTDESLTKESSLMDQIEGYSIMIEGQDVVNFNTQDEILDYLKSIDKNKYLEAVEKFDFLNREMKIVEDLDLVNMEDDDPAVIEYMKRLESESTPQKIGTLNFCHHGYNQVGPTVWTPVANPRIKSKNRNRYSSITAVTSQILCTRTWWRGTHRFYWGTIDNLGFPMDNNSESYY